MILVVWAMSCDGKGCDRSISDARDLAFRPLDVREPQEAARNAGWVADPIGGNWRCPDCQRSK